MKKILGLLVTAFIHADYMRGRLDRAPELRLRMAKFGATPEDRARLRIQFAQAEREEDTSKPRSTPARTGRYKGLRSTGGGSGAVAGA